MARVKRGTTTKAKHKRLLENTRGFRHGRKNLVKMARQADNKAGVYAYRDRRVKKRTFRQLWIIKINAAYIELDRKVLADIAENNPEEFTKLVQKAK